ncbi:hypothetical protein ACFL35_15760, partial [Candidatus Riflebacteria bacterium]
GNPGSGNPGSGSGGSSPGTPGSGGSGSGPGSSSPSGGSGSSPSSTGGSGPSKQKTIVKKNNVKPTPFLMTSFYDRSSDQEGYFNSLVSFPLKTPLTEDVRIKFSVGYSGNVDPKSIRVTLMDYKLIYKDVPYIRKFGSEKEDPEKGTKFKTFYHIFRRSNMEGKYFIKISGRKTDGSTIPSLKAKLKVGDVKLGMTKLSASTGSRGAGDNQYASANSSSGSSSSSSSSPGGSSSYSNSSFSDVPKYCYDSYESSDSSGDSYGAGSGGEAGDSAAGEFQDGTSARAGNQGASAAGSSSSDSSNYEGGGQKADGSMHASVRDEDGNLNAGVGSDGSTTASANDYSGNDGASEAANGQSYVNGGNSRTASSEKSGAQEGSSVNTGHRYARVSDNAAAGYGSNSGNSHDSRYAAGSSGQQKNNRDSSSQTGNAGSSGQLNATSTGVQLARVQVYTRESLEKDLASSNIILIILTGNNQYTFNSCNGEIQKIKLAPGTTRLHFQAFFGQGISEASESVTSYSGSQKQSYSAAQVENPVAMDLNGTSRIVLSAGIKNSSRLEVLSLRLVEP